MKVNDVIKTIGETEILNKILGKVQNYPAGSISQRSVVRDFNIDSVSREEAEEIVSQLDKTITSAIMSFNPKLKR